jgi:hypothetical protein
LKTYQSFTKFTNQNLEEILVLPILVIRIEICIALLASLTRLAHLYHTEARDGKVGEVLLNRKLRKIKLMNDHLGKPKLWKEEIGSTCTFL